MLQDRHSDDGTSYCVTLSMIRVQLRCSSAEGYESRSGAVVLDAHNLELTSGHPTMHELGDLPSSASTTAWHLHWTRMLISHAPSGFRRASGVIMTGTVPASLESAGHDSPTASPHASVSERAMIVGRQSRTQTSSVKTAITVMLPALQVVLAKPAVNGLQFWTDDVSQLMARLQATDPSQLAATSSSRGPSMIGSRFFARYGSRNGSVSSTPSADTSRSETVMRLEIKQGSFDNSNSRLTV
jgi:autophagy-related protein 2